MNVKKLTRLFITILILAAASNLAALDNKIISSCLDKINEIKKIDSEIQSDEAMINTLRINRKPALWNFIERRAAERDIQKVNRIVREIDSLKTKRSSIISELESFRKDFIKSMNSDSGSDEFRTVLEYMDELALQRAFKASILSEQDIILTNSREFLKYKADTQAELIIKVKALRAHYKARQKAYIKAKIAVQEGYYEEIDRKLGELLDKLFRSNNAIQKALENNK